MRRLYILDVSGYLFRAYFALPPMSSPQGEAVHAVYGFIRSLLKLLKNYQPDHLVAVFDGPENKKARQELYQEYKANRVHQYEDLPEQIDKAQTFCRLFGIPQLAVPGVEADDTIGSIAEWAARQGSEVFLFTGDKDFCQLVNDQILVINPWKEGLLIDRAQVEALYGVRPDQMADFLALVGDSSDNIPGVKGLGPKTSAPLLQEFGSLENLFLHLDEIKSPKKRELLAAGEESARLSKMLATIRTDIPFPKEEAFFCKQEEDRVGLQAFYTSCGFRSLLAEWEKALPSPREAENTSYQLINDLETLEKVIAYLHKAEAIAVDIETTALHPLQAEAVGIGFSVQPGEAFYLPFHGEIPREKAQALLAPLFADERHAFLGHNIKYDLHLLETLSLPVARLGFDTILASSLLDAGDRHHSLEALSLRYLGLGKTSIKTLIGTGKKEIRMDQVPIPQVSAYCCQDVDYTLRLSQLFKKELHARGLDPLLYDLELPLTRVLVKMERAGMYLKPQVLEKFGATLVTQIAQIEEEIYLLAGERFNLNSPKQLSHILFEKLHIPSTKKTQTGLSTNAAVLEGLAKTYPIAEKLLTFRTLDKLRSTYVEALPLEIDPQTGRIHPLFNQFSTATGRLSCQQPNLQNIPIRTALGREIRAAFMPQQEGWSYLSADYSQIELRLLAHLSQDPSLLAAFRQGEDVHTHTASQIFMVAPEAVTYTQRQQAKTINFGILYGQQAYGLSQELGIPLAEAAAFITAYFARYPAVQAYLQKGIDTTRRTEKAVTLLGRERAIPEINSKNTIARQAAERLAVNTPLQGSAADLIKKAMLTIDEALTREKLRSFMVLQIHDELIFEAPDEELDTLRPLVKHAMEEVFSLEVPLLVNLSVGKNWAEC